MEIVGAHVVFHRKLATSTGEVEAVLLCKRTQDAPSDPGRWSLPGGMLDSGETAETAAQREVREELEAPRIHLETALGRMTYLCDVPVADTKGVRFFKSPLAVDMDELRLRRTDRVEGEGLGWFTGAEVRHLDMRQQDRSAAIAYFDSAP